ncbi:MAG: hypothetical protein ACJAYU_002689 [Bradymonadia bacterium]|jgi:hypothetical protein
MRCTGTLRLSYETLEPLGHAIDCASRAAISEEDARQIVVDRLSVAGPVDMSDASMISDPNSLGGYGVYLFYQAPSDFGAVAAVNSSNGSWLWGASIVWAGAGDIVHPTPWGDPAALSDGCGQLSLSDLPLRSYDLTSGDGAREVDVLDDVLAATAETVLAEARLDGTAAFLNSIVVVVYPRSVGEFNPATAGYIVFINAGF